MDYDYDDEFTGPAPNPDDYEIIEMESEPAHDPSKTGPVPGVKSKKLVAVEVYGYEVGRGKTKRVVFPDDVFRLAAMGCNDREIAQWFTMSEATLTYNFKDIIVKGREFLKQSLRRSMLRNAIKNNNAAVQIFLSKNILSMSDTPGQTIDNPILPWSDDE